MSIFIRTLKSLTTTGVFAALSVLAAQSSMAQDRYPSQPIKIVVPYAPGGSTDLIARQFGEQLSREMGQTVLVENKPGGATNIGAELVARSKADGYTLLFANNGQVLNPIFGPVPPFELSALTPISEVARVAFVIAANPKTPFNTGAELFAAAKANPGKYTISSANVQLYVDLFNSKAGINLLHVPYKGGAPATTDAISGQVDMVFALVPVLQQHIQAGKLKALAVTTGNRIPSMPSVQSMKDLGVDYDIAIWYGLMAPAGTPKSIVDQIASATQKIMTGPEMATKIRATGAEPVWNKPDDFQAQLKRETVYWQQVAKTMPHLIQK